MTTRYEVNYAEGHELQLHLLNAYEIPDALNVSHGQWNKWSIVTKPSGARRIPTPILSLDKEIRPEHLWISLYLVARAYAYLNQEDIGRAERTEHIGRAIAFCETGAQHNPDCRLRKLYVDFLKMLHTDKPTFQVPWVYTEESYMVPSTAGIPAYQDLAKFIGFILKVPPQAGYCTGPYVPHLHLEQRVVSSYEYASFSTMIFQQEADAILCTLAE